MSSNIQENKTKKVAIVVANASVSKTTGWQIGFWWAELTHPYLYFKEHGYEVEIFSPEGGDLVADSYSDPEDASGYSAHDIISLGFKKSPITSKLIQNTKKVSEIISEDFDAIFLTGGQSPMYTFIENETLHKKFVEFYEKGKIVAAICHATCILLKAKKSDGTLLVENKTWTGFADSEEQYADSFVGQKIQPFWIESEAKKVKNTNYINAGQFKSFAIRDGNLITGQQQMSGTEAAKLVVTALGA
jgi:putative intracellular protease/amidase